MSECIVYFKENDAEITEVISLVDRINAIKSTVTIPPLDLEREDEITVLNKYLEDTSPENTALRTFLSHAVEYCGDVYSGISEIARHDLKFVDSELHIDIIYEGNQGSPFDTAVWETILCKTFPNLSFLLVGYTDVIEGSCIDFIMYNKGELAESTRHSFTEEELYDAIGEEAEEVDLDEMTDLAGKFIDARVREWKICDGDGERIKAAKKEVKLAQKKYDAFMRKIFGNGN